MPVIDVPLVVLSGAGLTRLGRRGLLCGGIFAAALRWIVCGLSQDLSVIYRVELLPGVTAVELLLGASLYLEAVAPERLRSMGQALLAVVGIGWGGAVSNAAAGWLL